jgi:hypothetical protein
MANGGMADVSGTGSGTDTPIKQHRQRICCLDNRQSLTETRYLRSLATDPGQQIKF